jgi:hypothetical protein
MNFTLSRRKARLPLIAAAVGACFAGFAGNAMAADVATVPELTAALAGTDAIINVAPGVYTPTATIAINRTVTIRRNPAFATGSVVFSGSSVTTPSPAGGALNVFHVLSGANVTMIDLDVNTSTASTDNLIENFGTLNFNYSTAQTSSGPGIAVRTGATLNTLNATISDNAGIGVLGTGTAVVNLRSTTLTNNGGAAVSVPLGGTLNLVNSLVTSLNPAGAPFDCAVVADSVSFVLGSDTASTCGAGTIAGNGNTNLNPLALTAPGTTPVNRLLPGHLAIDAGAGGANCPADDQRHVARPGGAACDIGAFEVNSASVTVPASFNYQATAATTTVPFTANGSNPETGAALPTTCVTAPVFTVTGSAPNFSVALPIFLPVAPVTVTCTATNAATSQSASASFTITVIDLVAPTFTSQPTDPQTATSPDGLPVAVTFAPAATANDAVSGLITPVCRTGSTSGPVVVSGALFPVGSTSVFCTATDPHANFATISFAVVVTDGSANFTVNVDPSNVGANVSSNGQVILDRNITTRIAVSRTVDFGRITMGGTYTNHTPVNPFVQVGTNAVNGYNLFVNRTVFSNPQSPFFNTANGNLAQGNGRTDDIPLALDTVLAAPGTPTNPLIASVARPTAASLVEAQAGFGVIPVAPPAGLRDPAPNTAGGTTALLVGSRQTYTLEDGDTWTTRYRLGVLSYAPAGPAASVVTYTATVNP